jgi:hypothetical protein
VSLAIGTAIAGDVNMKLMYALIGQRNSRKGMLMTAIGAAFGDLIDAGKSAKKPCSEPLPTTMSKNTSW